MLLLVHYSGTISGDSCVKPSCIGANTTLTHLFSAKLVYQEHPNQGHFSRRTSACSRTMGFYTV